MNQLKYISLLCFGVLLSTSMLGQDKLSLEEAIQQALENNYQIRIRKFDADISAKQVNPALVGKKPSLDFNASYELGWSDANIETLSFAPGGENSELELDGISNDVLMGLEVSLLLLDGKASTYRLEQLRTGSNLAQLQLQQTLEQTVVEVTVAYIQMAQQQSLMDITRQNIALTQERLDRAKEDASYGTSSSLQELQIEVDLKTDSAVLRNQVLTYENERRNLNYLMGQESGLEYTVDTNLAIDKRLSISDLETKLRQQNTILKLNDQNIQLADLDVQLREAAFKPTLQGYANMNFAYLQDEANFLQSTRAFGPNIGVRFRYPIFDGGARKIQKETAVMTFQQRQLERLSIEDELVKELQNAYATYQNTLEQLRIEESNLVAFERNLENMQNMYDLGTATNTDVRTAQLNLNAAQNRINNYQYIIKQAEVSLYLLSGQLIE